MVEAICWDASCKVTAQYAHSNRDFSYFCPHCLSEVHAKHRVNTYFVATTKHIPGCPSEARSVESDALAQEPKKKESIVPPAPIPTELGLNRRPAKKNTSPTHQELQALAKSLSLQQPYCSGALNEVVDAWLLMDEAERNCRPLTLRGVLLTYQEAFYFLGAAGDVAADAVPFGSRVIYGAARVTYDVNAKCYWVTSAKKFPTTTGKAPLSVRAPEGSLAAMYLKTFLPSESTSQNCILFYSGGTPKASASGNSYTIPSDISDRHWRFTLI